MGHRFLSRFRVYHSQFPAHYDYSLHLAAFRLAKSEGSLLKKRNNENQMA